MDTFARLPAPERTFWEKATILHAEYHRPAERSLPGRLSRHYYDLFQLRQKKIHTRAMENLVLLQEVADHKNLFFPCAWARYQDSYLKQLHLAPPSHRVPALQADYKNMALMFFEPPPTFGEIMESLAELETAVNRALPPP